MGSAPKKAARQYVGPQLQVGAGVADHRRLAGRAGGSVDADDLASRYQEQAERVVLAEVVLYREREVPQVIGRAELVRLYVEQPLPIALDTRGFETLQAGAHPRCL